MDNLLRTGLSQLVGPSTRSSTGRGNQRTTRSTSLPPTRNNLPNSYSDYQEPPREILDVALQQEFDRMSQSDQSDYMAFRLQYLPSQILANPTLELQQMQEELDNNPEVLLPNFQPLTLQQKLELAASKRLLEDRNKVLQKALESLQRLPPQASYSDIVATLSPHLLTDEEAGRVADLYNANPYLPATLTSQSRVNISLENFQLKG